MRNIVIMSLWLLIFPLVSGLDSTEASSSPARTLIAVIAPRTGEDQTSGWQDGDTSPPPDAQPDAQSTGMISQAADERREQMEDEGYRTEVRYFSSLQAFLCWLYEQEEDQWVHVEIYGHGSPGGPHDGENAGFADDLGRSDVDNRWRALGQQLGRVMTSGPGKNGHIVFGWCKGVGDEYADHGTTGGMIPAAIVAHHSGKPVYTTGENRILYPHYKDEDGTPTTNPEAPGVEYGQPHPEGDVEIENTETGETETKPGAHAPGRDGEEDPGDSGWVKFPPGHPDGEVAGGETVPPSGRTGAKIPKSPAEGGTDPGAGNGPNPEQPTTPDNEPNSPPPDGESPTIPKEEVGC